MMTETSTISILALFGGGGVGGFLGAWLGHFFTERRDRENRKRNFRGFLAEWRAIAEQTDTRDIPHQYFEHVRLFRREAERVRGDFSDTEGFSRHVIALGHMTPKAIQGDGSKQSRALLADTIQAFLDFTNDP